VKLIVHYVGSFVYIDENSRSKKQNPEHDIPRISLKGFSRSVMGKTGGETGGRRDITTLMYRKHQTSIYLE
jgi:hypothetical protein